MKRVALAIGSGLLFALAFAVPAWAGGWAVITLDELPGDVVAGEPFEVGFMVRQHGVRPMEGLAPTVHVQPAGPGKTLMFTAEEKGETGHYVATLNLPEAGDWEWSIEAFTGKQPMPALTVMSAARVPVVEKPAEAPASVPAQWPQWLAGSLGAAGILVGVFIVLRQKARWAIALILAGLVVSAGSIVLAADQPEAESASVHQMDAEYVTDSSSVSQVELGRQLFIAKGCMMCHSHSETDKIREFGTDLGPDLTDITASPEYLRMWLTNPLAVKSTATMPMLGLSDDEVEALIAFINAD